MDEREIMIELLNPRSHISRTRSLWLKFLADAYEAMQVPFTVTSWWRTTEHNAAVGGLPNSRHLTGDAIDVVWQDETDLPILKVDASRMRIRLVREGDNDNFQTL